MWYQQADFIRVQYLQYGLSDHTPLLLQLLNSPRPSKTFQFCDMWARDTSYLTIIKKWLPSQLSNPLQQLLQFQTHVQRDLTKLNQNRFHDLRAQQITSRLDLDANRSSMSTQGILSFCNRNGKHKDAIFRSSPRYWRSPNSNAKLTGLNTGMQARGSSLPRPNNASLPHMSMT